jgi:hypothetical protein
MAAQQLRGKRVAILATDGVEATELTEPRKALDEAGARTVVVSPKNGSIKGWEHDHWGPSIAVDQSLDGARADQFDVGHGCWSKPMSFPGAPILLGPRFARIFSTLEGNGWIAKS